MTHPIDLDELIEERDQLSLDCAELEQACKDLDLRIVYLTAALLEIRNGNHSRQEARSIADGALRGEWEKPE